MKFFLIIILILCFLPSAFAQTLKVDEVLVDCVQSEACKERTSKFKNIVGDYRSLVHLKDTIRLMTSDGGYKTFVYELMEEGGKNTLNIRFRMKPTINEVDIGFMDRNLESDPKLLLALRQGEYYEENKVKENIADIPKKLEALGYPYATYTYEIVEKNNLVDVNVVIKLNNPIIFKSVTSDAKSPFIKQFLKNKFNKFYNKPFEANRYKLILDEAQRDLFSYGYYTLNMEFIPTIKGQRVILDIKVQNEAVFAFDFVNLNKDHHFAVLNLLTDLLRKFKRPLSDVVIKQAISSHYENMAYLNVKADVVSSKFVTKFNEVATLYRITFHENNKTILSKVSFEGNRFFTDSRLKRMFEREAFELASIDYYDQAYFDYFTGYLKNQYIGAGFVSAQIRPLKTFDQDKTNVDLTYNIMEGQRAFLRSINFLGLPSEFENEIVSQFQNQVGKPFNPIKFAEDVKSVSQYLQNRGYYFAEVTNATDDNIVSYSANFADVEVFIAVKPGQLVKLNRVILLGNSKTRKRVIMKKIPLEKDDIVTPSKTKEIESSLSATGLFNSVTIYPVKHNSKNPSTDLVVRVQEREYGLLELSPGYRTDLGLKLTGTVSYTNIGGANRSITLTGQVNRRTSYSFFDERRQLEQKKLLEYLLNFNFNQGDVFDTLVDYGFGLTNQRRRFYAFDADIFRFNNTFTRDITKRFSTSIRHQYERITQFDATNERDRGSFQIGAMTPSFTYDLRNSPVLPVKGAFFNLSCEFANPYFLSQKTTNLEVNYYKLISRNRFYIPFKNGTIAISLVSGVQENLSNKVIKGPDGKPETVTDQVDVNNNGNYNDPEDKTLTYKRTAGYIPNIKLFRLTGMDIVRGYTDEEINKLPDRYDITDVRVQNAAFLTNFKLEPRYFLNDSLMAGVFYDAGRVQVDQMDLGELRSSVGVTFKVITPVGTLDFDYGVKLLRKRNLDGSLESPGRFHVSIGFF